ncbi:hypothetical protein CQW39_29670 [Streptomyces griseofuscus]|uniref:Uncharacterized protein n=1 Tax=Streptomyces griseofuscus TaxID=146922 RepID=A0A1X4H6H6_9ACTN|nr:hypothetical protein CQW39_29670 [Streptomyces griseofuscus]RRQ86555.1 hypothetical protein CQW44_11845 [Streptomyces griseofuscus]
MFQDAPIYHQLVAERGDVPARVRDAATSILRELEHVMGGMALPALSTSPLPMRQPDASARAALQLPRS